MSKKEMVRLRNKFKLWEILHPGINHCHHCKHISGICPDPGLTLLENGEVVIMNWSENQKTQGHRRCMEWIKNV